MNRVVKFLFFFAFAVLIGVVQAPVVQSADNPPAAPEFKQETGKVLFYSEPHDEGKVAVGDQKIDFNSLAFKSGVVTKGDTVTFETDGKKVKKGSMAKQ